MLKEEQQEEDGGERMWMKVEKWREKETDRKKEGSGREAKEEVDVEEGKRKEMESKQRRI